MSTVLNIILAAVVLLLSSYLLFFSKDGKQSSTENAVLNNILTRTSVRSYTKQPIEKEKVEQLLRAAMAAPTAANKQPWTFVVVDDRATLDSLAANLPHAQMALKATLGIVVCGDMNKTLEGEGREYWTQDVSAATENLLLAAHAMGLGAVWTGIYPISDRVAAVQKLLGLPENIIPHNLTIVGYPDAPNTPKDKWKPELIHQNKW